MSLAENSWISLMVVFPVQLKLEDRLHNCLDSQVRLTRWSGLGSLLSIRGKYELVSLPGDVLIISLYIFIRTS